MYYTCKHTILIQFNWLTNFSHFYNGMYYIYLFTFSSVFVSDNPTNQFFNVHSNNFKFFTFLVNYYRKQYLQQNVEYFDIGDSFIIPY